MRHKQKPFHLLFAYVSGICICSCLILLSAGFVEARLEESPAGGGWLQLDDEHDFVGTFKEWFPEEQFEELTAEAWIYTEESPDPGISWSIIGQEGRFNLVIHSFQGGGLATLVHADDSTCSASSVNMEIPRKTWMHVAVFCSAGAGFGLNGSGWVCPPGGHLLKSDKSLRIGGLIPIPEPHLLGENVKLQGYVDAVRISSAIRYNRCLSQDVTIVTRLQNRA